MPLLDWQISEVVTDFPSEVQINPSPWTTRLGQTLSTDWSSAIFYNIYVLRNGNKCLPKILEIDVNRSRFADSVEGISLSINESFLLVNWIGFVFILFLCGAYIWWFTIWYKRPFADAISYTVIAIILFCFLIDMWGPLGAKVGPPFLCSDYQGIITFNARVSFLHFETLVVLFAGVIAELGALGMILHQIIKAIIERKSSAKSDVGDR
jgi:hypothetical protein